jgi:hypothetical protein
MTVIVRNEGTAEAAPPTVSLFYSGFTQLSLQGAGFNCIPGLPACMATAPLAPGGELSLTASMHAVGVNAVGWIEAWLSTGDFSHGIVLIGDHPDLELTGTAPTAVEPGAEAQFALNVRNVGNVAVAGPLTLEVSTAGLENPRVSGWNCDPVDPEDPEYVSCTRSGGLAPGAVAPPTTSSTCPPRSCRRSPSASR